MSVAVSCNLSDGVILGVDSAAAVPAAGGIAKVYENAEKLFQLADRPIGIAAFGLGGLGARTLGSYIREFEVGDPSGVVSGSTKMADVVEALRDFFLGYYRQTVVPAVEKSAGKKFEELPPDTVPGFGLVVGGFSSNAYLSEVWEIYIPQHNQPGSAKQRRAPGNFGTNWYAMFEPIRRYIKGYDQGLLNELMAYLQSLRGSPFSATEQKQIGAIIGKYQNQVPFAAMPMEEGVAHTRFLVELVINHHRFVAGPPVVGGRARIGKVTYRGEKFQILGA